MNSREARETLKTLERLICVAELVRLDDPMQRAALAALRGRRAALRRIIARRRSLEAQKVVCLSAWREAPLMARERRPWASTG